MHVKLECDMFPFDCRLIAYAYACCFSSMCAEASMPWRTAPDSPAMNLATEPVSPPRDLVAMPDSPSRDFAVETLAGNQ